MKKLLCVILALLMLVPALASCNDTTTPGGPGTPGVNEDGRVKLMVDGVSQYTLIRSDAASDNLAMTLMQRINSVIRSATGIDMAMDSDWDKKDMTKPEILIGETNRPESKEVLDTLGPYDYAVKQVGNKIVIVGKNQYTTTVAANYFINEVLEKNGSSSEGYFSLPESFDYVNANPGTIVFAEGSTPKYTVIYTKDYADRYNYSYYDYNFDEKTVAQEFAVKLQDKFKVVFKTAMDHIFNEEAVKTSPEILVGNCDRDATRDVKAGLEYNEYAIKVIGSKLVIVGHGFMSTYEGLYKCLEILDEFKIEENGVTKIILPANFDYVGVYENGEEWILDVPEYKGGKYDSASDLGLDLDTYVVKYKETNVDEYNAYLAELESAGYTKYATNEIDGNLFATYTSKSNGNIRVQFAPVYSQTTIIVQPSKAELPALESENTKAAVTTTKLVQLKISNMVSENGQCHIFRLNDGRFIVFDGGGEPESSDLIYDKLVELNVLDGKPVIAAWIFTHHHGDHTGTYLSRFSSMYKNKVDIESFIYSFPADGYYAVDETLKWDKGVKGWKSFQSATKSADHVTPFAGDVWYFGDLKMTCLYTQAEMLPDTFEFYNDSSSVYMFEVGGQKIFITGDASENVCHILVDMYPTYLKCDILQFPHHGHYGATIEFADATDPSVVLIPASRERWLNKLNKSSYVGSATLRYLLAKKTVKEKYIHGLGTVEFDLPYKGK